MRLRLVDSAPSGRRAAPQHGHRRGPPRLGLPGRVPADAAPLPLASALRHRSATSSPSRPRSTSTPAARAGSTPCAGSPGAAPSSTTRRSPTRSCCPSAIDASLPTTSSSPIALDLRRASSEGLAHPRRRRQLRAHQRHRRRGQEAVGQRPDAGAGAASSSTGPSSSAWIASACSPCSRCRRRSSRAGSSRT